MIKTLLILLTLFSITGCTTKEVEVLNAPCAKPTINMNSFKEPTSVPVNVHKGAVVVTMSKEDYNNIKNTNQDIKDRYIKLREWVLLNIEEGLINFK